MEPGVGGPAVSRNIPIRVDVHREEKRIKTVCQNTDKTINNNCLVSEDKTPGGGEKSDTDKPPVLPRSQSGPRTNGGEGGGPGVNSPHHPGVRRNTGVIDTQPDTQAEKKQQFENIQGQLEVQISTYRLRYILT